MPARSPARCGRSIPTRARLCGARRSAPAARSAASTGASPSTTTPSFAPISNVGVPIPGEWDGDPIDQAGPLRARWQDRQDQVAVQSRSRRPERPPPPGPPRRLARQRLLDGAPAMIDGAVVDGRAQRHSSSSSTTRPASCCGPSRPRRTMTASTASKARAARSTPTRSPPQTACCWSTPAMACSARRAATSCWRSNRRADAYTSKQRAHDTPAWNFDDCMSSSVTGWPHARHSLLSPTARPWPTDTRSSNTKHSPCHRLLLGRHGLEIFEDAALQVEHIVEAERPPHRPSPFTPGCRYAEHRDLLAGRISRGMGLHPRPGNSRKLAVSGLTALRNVCQARLHKHCAYRSRSCRGSAISAFQSPAST